jgi:hypothetical protein
MTRGHRLARAITADIAGNGCGMPAARADADGVVILAGQNPDGPGALIQVTTRDAARRQPQFMRAGCNRDPADSRRPPGSPRVTPQQ